MPSRRLGDRRRPSTDADLDQWFATMEGHLELRLEHAPSEIDMHEGHCRIGEWRGRGFELIMVEGIVRGERAVRFAIWDQITGAAGQSTTA
ncbi:hypothetical protein [Streptomyces sp. NPDC058424]|uniref:hypothetical protein n=1 Tax=Streptomyces sp. NPDC058424 TaxID=3346491 RepID=UPI0036645270